ncbi:MAG TPA: hypothetical protein VLF61_02345 [Rhabdochlamydiaceae bacterium]|nr:hypothetical protein [Rhabdochlamydiaceae bacterium]
MTDPVNTGTIVITKSEFKKFAKDRSGKVPDAIERTLTALNPEQKKNVKTLLKMIAKKQAEQDSTTEKTKSVVCKQCGTKVFYSTKPSVALNQHRKVCRQG